MDNFKVTTFSVSKRHRSLIACQSCKRRHAKCIIEAGKDSCETCLSREIDCKWDPSTHNRVSKSQSKVAISDRENIYQRLFLDNNYTNQFVCGTQPLSLLLSKDSFLCFDGDKLGLYYPWRENDHKNTADSEMIDSGFKRYLETKGTFSLPPVSEQRRLLGIFLDKIYPLYPVFERSLIDNIKSAPLLLLNAIFLVSVRFDERLQKESIRLRADELYEKCKLLELIEKNKITLIQSFLLLSYHEEGIDGSSSSKEYISKACNLCGELAITTMGGTNGIMNNQTVGSANRPFKKVKYEKKLLLRIFWVSVCCDRFTSATCLREIFYSDADIMVDPPGVDDFDEGEYQLSDFKTFNTYLSMSSLIERVQFTCYRPPKSRCTDDLTLEKDLLIWKENNLNNFQSDMKGFLKIAYAYTCILYFRCHIDAISLIFKEAGIEDNKEAETKYLRYIDSYSKDILEIIESDSYIHHVVVVHAVLHTIALAQVQIKTSSSPSHCYYEGIAKRSMCIMYNMRHLWWQAGSALYLCKEVMPDQFKNIKA